MSILLTLAVAFPPETVGNLWFALGGLIPVIIHLLHRQRYQKIRWAAMEFLLAAIKKTQRRIQFENLLLLLLRIAIMCLLALAIARPMLESSVIPGAEQPTHTVLVIDNSYSMGYRAGTQSNFFKAKAAAKEVLDKHLRKFTQTDRISLITMSNFPEIRLKHQNDKEKLKELIDELTLSDYGTSMLQTCAAIKKLIDDPAEYKNAIKRIYLITDLQRGAWILDTPGQQTALKNALKNLSQRKDVIVYLIDVGLKEMPNYAIIDLRMDQAQPTLGSQVQFAAEVFNFDPQPQRDIGVTFFVDGLEKQTRKTTLPASSKVEVAFAHTFDRPGPHSVEARIDPDRLDVDDKRYAALEVRESVRVLAVDGDPGGPGQTYGETHFYQVALDPFGNGGKFAVRTTTRTFLTGEDLSRFDVIVLANCTSLPEEFVPLLEKFVADGGGLYITLGANVEPRSYNELLWKEGKGLLPAKLGTVMGDSKKEHEWLLTDVRTGHAIFRPFPEKQLAALRSVGVFQYYSTEGAKEDNVLARYQDNAKNPAFIEKSFGADPSTAGRVVLFTSTLDHEWTNGFQGWGIYLMFHHVLTRYLAERRGSNRNLFVGESIALRLPTDLHSPEFLLSQPSGVQVTLKPPEIKPGDKYFDLFYPTEPEKNLPEKIEPSKEVDVKLIENYGLQQSGLYLIKRRKERPAEDELVASFACNVPPRSPRIEEVLSCEGNLDRLPPDDLAKEFPDFKCTIISEKSSDSEKINVKGEGSDIWRQILFALIALLLGESLLALFFGRRKQ